MTFKVAYDKYKHETLDITPDIARDMLTYNYNNRPLRENVKLLAEKMKRGEWAFTHQGIAFEKNGRLLDGQHRLHAIVLADTTITMPVTYGLDAVYDHIDVNSSQRTAADLLSTSCPSLKNKTTLCTTARTALMGIAGEFRPRADETARFVEERHEHMQPIVDVLRKGGKLVANGPVLGAFYAAVRYKDNWPGPQGGRVYDDIMLVAMRLVDQTWDGRHDPMKTLFNRLLRSHVNVGSGLSAIALYGITVAAVRAALANKTLAAIQVTTIDWGDKNDRGGSFMGRRPGATQQTTKRLARAAKKEKKPT